MDSRPPLRVRLLTLILCGIGVVTCDSTQPSESVRPQLGARWTGIVNLDTLGNTLSFDLQLTQSGDSVVGTVAAPFHGQTVLVTGTRFGDSVHVHMQPAEDTPVDILGVLDSTTITGVFWFSILPTMRFPLTLYRAP